MREVTAYKYNMKKFKLVLSVFVVIAVWGCQNQSLKNQYRIGEDHVGPLTKATTVQELKTVFKTDSVVHEDNSRRFSNRDEYVVFHKGDGRELLRLKPASSDSTSAIATVQVVDTLFKTQEGLGIGTTFGDLSEHYEIDKIENTLGTAMVFLKDSNIYFDLSKEELYEPTQMGVEIKASQIKRKARVKHLWLDWDNHSRKE